MAKSNAELLPNNVLRLRESGLIADKKGYEEGEWWVQDYSSQLPVKCLNIKENDGSLVYALHLVVRLLK